MNIAFGLVSREPGGAEFQTCLLADALRTRGHQVWLYCVHPDVSDRMLDQFAPFPTRVLRRPQILRGPGWSLSAGLQFRRWLWQDRIEAAVGVLPLPHGLLTLACLGTRIRLIARRSCVWSELYGYGAYDASLPKLVRWVKRWGWRTSGIVANSVAAAQSASQIEGWPPGFVRIIPNGWPEYEAVDGTSSVPYYVARPRAEKAVDLATREFAKAGVPLALSFEPPNWREVGILVHASRADSCSNAVGMAMAHGIPVVAFDLAGNRELLAPGRLVPQWQYRVMAGGVKNLMDDYRLRQGCGRHEQERVRVGFPLKVMVDGWEEVLGG